MRQDGVLALSGTGKARERQREWAHAASRGGIETGTRNNECGLRPRKKIEDVRDCSVASERVALRNEEERGHVRRD